MTKIKFQLPPIADPGTKFVGAEPKFATIRQKVCFVNCESSATADQDAVSGLSLMMRKTKSGWRVAGMMLMDEEQETQNLLSFENLTDLGQIKDSVQFIDTEMDSQ